MFTLVSTTESQPALEAASGAGDSWKTPPDQSEKPANPGDVPADIPQKLFNEIREEQIAAKKKAGPALFEGEAKKDVESPIRNYEAAKQRDRAAEAHKRELRSILDGVSGERASGESQSQPESRPAEQNGNENGEYERHWQAAAASYPDFEETMAAGVGMSKKLEAAIRAIGNAGEIAHIAYGLSKNRELLAEVERDPSQLAQISPTFRHNQLSKAHQERMLAVHKADPAAVALVAAANIPITPAVRMAVLEQDNSDALVIHFAKNPEVLEELNRLPVEAAMSRVGRLAEKLESKSEDKRERGKVRPPAPISPVTSSGTRTGSSLENMSMRDYIKVRNKQERDYKSRWR